MIVDKTKNWNKLKNEFKLLKPLHYALIMCLSNEDYPENKDGWLKLNEIIKIKNPQTERLYFTSNKTSFPKYIKDLLQLGLVEKKEIKIPNKYKYRESGHYYYRLKQDISTYFKIREHIGNYDLVNNLYQKKSENILLIIFDNSAYAKNFEKNIEVKNIWRDKANDEYNKEKNAVLLAYSNVISDLLFYSNLIYENQNQKELQKHIQKDIQNYMEELVKDKG